MPDGLLHSREAIAHLSGSLLEIRRVLGPSHLHAGPDFGALEAVAVTVNAAEAIDTLLEQVRQDADNLSQTVEHMDRALDAIDRFLADAMGHLRGN